MFDANMLTIIRTTIWNKDGYHVTHGQGRIQGQRSNYRKTPLTTI
jgi:hypothetical protein